MPSVLRENFKGLGNELLARIRGIINGHTDEAVSEEKIIGIQKATAAMMEAGVVKEVIIQMLQKYWDLRMSEAIFFIEECKNKDV